MPRVTKTTSTDFSIGEPAFCVGVGVGIITDISTEHYYGADCRFAHISFTRHDGSIQSVKVLFGLPSSQLLPLSEFVGKTKLSSAKKTLQQEYSERSPFRAKIWHVFFTSLEEKINKATTLQDMLVLLKDVCRDQTNGICPPTERLALIKWKQWVIIALAYAHKKEPEWVEARLDKALLACGRYPFPK